MIADRLGSAEPLDTAFALREAAVSAGELGRWEEAKGYFVRAQKAAVTAAEAPNAFSIGLAVDAAAACFEAGDQIGGVRAMAVILKDVATVDPQADRKTRYCHLLARHVVLWMQSHFEPNLTVQGGPVVYVAGAASNPAPPAGIDDRPVSPLRTAWNLLCRVALHIGLPADEVLNWSGVIELRNFAVLDVELRMLLLEAAIEHGSLPNFHSYLAGAAEAIHYVASSDWRRNPPDPFTFTASPIPPLPEQDFKAPTIKAYLRDATIAMAAGLVLPEPGVAVDLGTLHASVNDLVGYDLMPEWLPAAAEPKGDIANTVAHICRILAYGQPASIDGLFLTHLRLLEWLSNTSFRRVLDKRLAERVHKDWEVVIEARSAFLVDPSRTVPPLLDALRDKQVGEVYVAGVLLAAEPAVQTGLSEVYRDRLIRMLLANPAA